MQTRIEEAMKRGQNLNWVDLLGGANNITVENMWRIFATISFHGKTISTIQYQETKRTYFLAFAECFKIMNDVAVKFDDDEADKILTRIMIESNNYIRHAVEQQARG